MQTVYNNSLRISAFTTLYIVPWPSSQLPQLQCLLQEPSLASNAELLSQKNFLYIFHCFSAYTLNNHAELHLHAYSLNWLCVASHLSSAI